MNHPGYQPQTAKGWGKSRTSVIATCWNKPLTFYRMNHHKLKLFVPEEHENQLKELIDLKDRFN